MIPTIGVGAFIFDGPRMLVIQRGRPPGEGLWSVPGGRLEAGETLAQAVVREVREETGLAVEVGPFVCVVERIGERRGERIGERRGERIGERRGERTGERRGERIGERRGERFGEDFHFVILDYLARIVGGELAAGTDARDARFVTDAELAALPTTEGLLDVLARARAIRRPW